MVRASTAGLGGLFSLLLLCPAEAFYIPGWSIRSYREGDHVPLLVNKVYSDNTQLQYAYYDLPFVCPPTGRHRAAGGLLSGQSIPLNLGEVLRGDRIVASDMELAMGRDKACTALCTRELSRADVGRTRALVGEGYVVEWIVDNLPGATSFVTTDRTRKYYAAGFKLGFTEVSPTTGKPRHFLHNHHTIVIRYRKAPGRAGERGGKVIVGFEVYPKSVGNGNRRDASGCPADLQHVKGGFELLMAPNRTGGAAARSTDSPGALDEADGGDDEGTLSIPYTYSVYFREDASIEWSHRWDLYFVNQEDGSRIHWLAIVNSLIICGLLTGIVMIILAKTIRTDIKGYKEVVGDEAKARKRKPRSGARTAGEKPARLADAGADADEADDVSDEDEALEDVTGWKLLHADVFRRPRLGRLLAPLVGSGMQLLVVAVGLVLLSALGVLNPSFRGGVRQRRRRALCAGRPLVGLRVGADPAQPGRARGAHLGRPRLRRPRLRRPRRAQQRAAHGGAGPRAGVRAGAGAQPVRLGAGVEHGAPLHHARGLGGALAVRPGAARRRRRLLRLRARRALGAPDADGGRCAADSAAGVVRQAGAGGAAGGPDPLCRHLHRAALRLPVAVAGQERLLLRLRLPGRGGGHPGGDGGRGDGGDGLHAAVRREPPLVVSVVPPRRRQRRLGLWLLPVVLRLQAAHQRPGEQHAVLRLQLHGLLRLRAADGHRGLPERLRLCAADIRGDQG